MLKNKKVIKFVCSITAYAFVLSILPRPVKSAGLMPVSFDDMYSMARDGNVEGLRASVYRGLNIDSLNRNGDTGLCVAARRHDSYTYNSFRAAGANPRHPCVQSIPDYEEFVRNSRAVPVTENSRTAYAAMGKEEYKVAPWVWWTLGGAVVAGTVLAIVLSHGGGGSGGGSHDPSKSDSSKSLASLAARQGSTNSIAYSSSTNNTKYDVTNSKTSNVAAVNLYKTVLSETPYIDVILKAYNGGDYTNTADTILQAGSGVIAMNALRKSQVNNKGYINIDSYNASVGMVAGEESMAINNGKGIINRTDVNGIDLNFSGYKDTNTIIGMYADTKSSIINNGDIRGTAILATKDPTASTNNSSSSTVSSIVSSITGSSSNTSSTTEDKDTSSATGTLIGMEGRLIIADSSLSQYTINVTNSSTGQISLSAGDGGTDTPIKVNIIGMGSFLDDGFMNGSLNITRAEQVVLQNYNNIILGYTGVYTLETDKTLKKGTGGVVGMRADANTNAYNNGRIAINLEDYTQSSSDQDSSNATSSAMDVSAGMQSVHGGNITNLGNISIITSSPNERINYGMISVEGSGTVSGLYTPLNQTILNIKDGTITVEASNGYGMASFNGGNMINHGTITMGKVETTTRYNKNVAMYGYGNSTEVKMSNDGTINLYSYKSIAMENDFSGGTVLQNDGMINVFASAIDSYVFGGAYSEAYNNKIINYYATASKGTASTPGTAENPFANYNVSFSVSAMSTIGRDVNGNVVKSSASSSSSSSSEDLNSSTTEKIGNKSGAVITLDGTSFVAAMAVETAQGTGYNDGSIIINPNALGSSTNSVGMYIYSEAINSAGVTNNGSITTSSRFSAAMASESTNNAGMVNSAGATIVANEEYSLGMYASNKSYVFNNGSITMNGDNSAAMYLLAEAATVRNQANGVITVGSSASPVQNGYGIFAASGSKANIINEGTINLYTKNTGAAVNLLGVSSFSNKGNINVYGDNAYGIYISEDVSTSEGASVINEENGVINIGTAANPVQNSYGIFIDASSSDSSSESSSSQLSITNEGTINLYAKDITPNNSTAIYAKSIKKITNNGDINVTNANGIYTSGEVEIVNNGNITVTNGNGIYAYVPSKDTVVTITNSSTGVISVSGSGFGVFVDKDFYEYEDAEHTTKTIDKVTCVLNGATYDDKYKPEDRVSSNNTSNSIGTGALFGTSSASVKGVKLVNKGIISIAGNVDLGNENGETETIVGAGGQYQADSFTGELGASSDIVAQGFADEYEIEDALVGADNGVKVYSKSALFKATKSLNSSGNTNIALTRNSFDETVSNPQMGTYLENNYIAQNNESLFAELKSAESKQSLDDKINAIFGFNFMPNLIKQTFDTEKIVQREITEDILQKTDKNFRHLSRISAYKNEVDTKNNVGGYKDKVIYGYTYADENFNSDKRLGLGVSATRVLSDYDDGSSRYNNVIEVFAPFSVFSNNIAATFKPKLGFGRGHYRRVAESSVYKSNTKEYYYGADTQIKAEYDFGAVVFEPVAGFNLTGIYFDDVDESNAGLRTKSDNIISAQSVIGADIKKKLIFNDKNALQFKIGGRYYHEFADKSHTSSAFGNMAGNYRINHNRWQRNTGLVDFGAEYEFNGFSFGASANMPIEHKNNTYYMLDFGYAL